MRILLTTDVVGGVWGFTEELADALVARGHEVALAAFGGEPCAPHSAWLADRPWIEFVSLAFPLEWVPEPEPGLSASVPALLGFIARVQPDVIHLNQFFYGAHELGAPRIVTAHSDSVSWWHAVKGEAPPDDAWFRRYRRWVGAGLAGAHARTAPARWIARRTEEIYAAGPVRPIYNGRAPDRFLAPVDTPRARRAVTAGRLWDEAKGATDLADASAALTTAGIETVVAGPVRHPGRGRDFPMDASSVRWAGQLGATEIRGLLSGTAIYVATSLYEPFGLAPLEAVLAGCALVATDIPTFRELWDGCALFYPPGDSGALAEAVRQLADDDAGRLELARAAQARARERFTPERMAIEYEQVYEEARQVSARVNPRREAKAS